MNNINQKLLATHNLPENLEKITFYLGVDPTGPGIHVGHLIPIFLGMQLMKLGHNGVFLVGGFTGNIGDPTDKAQQRQKLEESFTENNVHIITKDLNTLLRKFNNYKIVNNKDWLSNMSFQSYIEKAYYISVNRKLHMDTFQKRIESSSHLSMAEFCYSDLQMLDFLHLYENFGCNTQIGGQDQWGNIAFGIDCVRKITKDQNIFGICTPLLCNNGEKISKSVGKTPYINDPQSIYDFILNLPDNTAKDLGELLDVLWTEDPIASKHKLIKFIIGLYSDDENSYINIHNINKRKFSGSLEDQEDFISVKSDKLLVILKNLCEDSMSELKRKLQSSAIKINNNIIESNDILLANKYKISLGKKQHFFIEVIN